METLIIAIFLFWFIFLSKQDNQIPVTPANTLDDIFKKYSSISGVDWRLLKAVAKTESSLNPAAIGDDGNSIGLMQVQLLVGKAYADISEKYELLDPDKNVKAGSLFLKHLIGRFGLENAIQAYNLGETKFLRGSRSIDYMNKVLKNYYSI